VLKLAAGSDTQSVVPFTGLKFPDAVAVDNAGDVYVTDSHRTGRVLELMAISNAQIELPFTGLNRSWGLAVDADRNVYVADSINERVLKLPAH
jgi:serine/threonine-protein kinase